MEKLYKKIGKKYVEAGYNLPDIPDGFYFSEKHKSGRRLTSISYWLGKNQDEPVDLQKLVSIMRKDELLSNYLLKIQDKNSDEFKKLNNDLNNQLTEPPKIINISTHDLAASLLRYMFQQLNKN